MARDSFSEQLNRFASVGQTLKPALDQVKSDMQNKKNLEKASALEQFFNSANLSDEQRKSFEPFMQAGIKEVQSSGKLEDGVKVMTALMKFANEGNSSQTEQLKKLQEKAAENGVTLTGDETPTQIGQMIQKQKKSMPAESAQMFMAEDSLRKDYETQSKPFQLVKSAYERVKASAIDPSPAGDMSMIFAYMKMLDPQSTVREGEQATATNAGAIPDKVRNFYNATINGKKLPPELRADYVDRANKLYEAESKVHAAIEEQYRGIAESRGYNVDAVLSKPINGVSSGKLSNGGTYTVKKIGA